MRRTLVFLFSITVIASQASAQQSSAPMKGMGKMDGMAGMSHDGGMAMGAQSGQAAFAAIADVVKTLKADSTTDWSKVNIEALRQHLIDMDNVMMRSQVRQTKVAGGLEMNVTGAGPVGAAIQRMVGMHAMMLGEGAGMAAKADRIPGGMRLVVTARDTTNTHLVAEIRGLGFAGLMTEGEHHSMHHLMVARGGMMMMGH